MKNRGRKEEIEELLLRKPATTKHATGLRGSWIRQRVGVEIHKALYLTVRVTEDTAFSHP